MDRVLVVAASDELAGALEDFLGGRGYDVRVALSGEDGIARAKEERPDLVVAELALPDMGAIRFLRAVRALDPHVSLLVVNGVRDEALARRIMEEGAFDYLPRNPLDWEHLGICASVGVLRTKDRRAC